MRTIIAGSRDITDWTLLLRAIHDARASFADGWPITRVLCGGQRGVDTLGRLWAEAHRIPVDMYPADWQRHGKRAGPMRNRDMACNADALILVHTFGRGSTDMFTQAKAHGLRIYTHVPGQK